MGFKLQVLIAALLLIYQRFHCDASGLDRPVVITRYGISHRIHVQLALQPNSILTCKSGGNVIYDLSVYKLPRSAKRRICDECMWDKKVRKPVKAKQLRVRSQTKLCKKSMVLRGLRHNRWFCVVANYTNNGAKSYSTYRPLKTERGDRPLHVRKTITDLKAVLSWRPRKKWQNKLVTYKAQTRITDSGSWVSRECWPILNNSCTLHFRGTVFCGYVRLRAVVRADSRGASDCFNSTRDQCSLCHCSTWTKLRVCLRKDSNFSAPVIGVDRKATSSLSVNMLLQPKFELPCDLSGKYHLSYREMNHGQNESECKNTDPSLHLSRKVEESFPESDLTCSPKQAPRWLKLEELKPNTSYCLVGFYQINKRRSFTNYTVVKTLPVAEQERSVSHNFFEENKTVFYVGMVVLGLITAAGIVYIAFAMKRIYRHIKKFKPLAESLVKMNNDFMNPDPGYRKYRSFEENQEPEIVNKIELLPPIAEEGENDAHNTDTCGTNLRSMFMDKKGLDSDQVQCEVSAGADIYLKRNGIDKNLSDIINNFKNHPVLDSNVGITSPKVVLAESRGSTESRSSQHFQQPKNTELASPANSPSSFDNKNDEVVRRESRVSESSLHSGHYSDPTALGECSTRSSLKAMDELKPIADYSEVHELKDWHAEGHVLVLQEKLLSGGEIAKPSVNYKADWPLVNKGDCIKSPLPQHNENRQVIISDYLDP